MKHTVADLIAHKGGRQLVQLNVASPEQAAAAEEAGIEMIASGREPLRKALRSAAPETHLCFGLIYGAHVNADQAKRAAFDALNDGADSIYCAMHFDVVYELAKEGIPVIGHVGLVPQKARWSGFRAFGKTAAEALEIYEDVRRYEDAGAFAVEIEVVPPPVAQAISDATPLIIISMGSGAGCDVQYLFAVDVLGETPDRMPRHARAYRDFTAEYDRLQQERIAAFAEFRADVASGAFPAAAELVTMAPGQSELFVDGLLSRASRGEL